MAAQARASVVTVVTCFVPPPPQVLATKGDLAKIQLTHPVCTKEGEKIALSRRVEKHWR